MLHRTGQAGVSSSACLGNAQQQLRRLLPAGSMSISPAVSLGASSICHLFPGLPLEATVPLTFEYPKSQILTSGRGLVSKSVFSSLMSLLAISMRCR